MSTKISFIQFSDLHLAEKANCVNKIDDVFGRSNFDPTEGPSSYDSNIITIIDDEIEFHSPNFVLISGDIVASAAEKNLKKAHNIFIDSSESKPPYNTVSQVGFYDISCFVPGNHDRMIFPENHKDNLMFLAGNKSNLQEYKSEIRTFSKYFGDKWDCAERYKINFDYEGLVFVFYDFSLPSDFLTFGYLKCAKKTKTINPKPYRYFGNGIFTDKDSEKLNKEFKAIKNNFPDREIIFISHFPLVSPKIRDKKSLALLNSKCLLKLLEKNDIKYYLAGHTHDYNYQKLNSVHHVSLPLNQTSLSRITLF